MSFTLLHDRACALSSDFGAYIARHIPYAEALSAALITHPSYAGLMNYLASQAPSGLFPYLFEERTIKAAQGARHHDYLCRLFHSSLSWYLQTTRVTNKALHVVHILNTILKSRLREGRLDFHNEDERIFAHEEEIRHAVHPDDPYYHDYLCRPRKESRVVKFLWPLYCDGTLFVKAITDSFAVNPADPKSRTLDQETLTALMVCALAYRLSSEPAEENKSSKPDVLFSFTAPFVNYKAQHTARGVKVALYNDANDPQLSAQYAMEKLFERHAINDPDLLFFATLLAQGAFSDASKPDVVNKTGLDHYVFSPCHLRFERKNAFTIVGLVIGLRGGMITHGQGAILSGSKEAGLTLDSDPAWTIGEFPNHLTPLLYDGIGSAHDLPDTDTLIAQYNDFEKSDFDDRYESWREGSDESMESANDIRSVAVNFLAHPHPVYAGFSLHDAYFSSGKLCPSLKESGVKINTYDIKDIDKFSISHTKYALRSFGKQGHPITKPLLMSLNRRGINNRRISFLLHEMLTRDNPYAALYKALRNGMICKNSRDYNLCISLLALSGARDAEKRLIQFAQLYPAIFTWLLTRLSSSHAHILSNLNEHDYSGSLTDKRLDNADLTFFHRDYTSSLSHDDPSSSGSVDGIEILGTLGTLGTYKSRSTSLTRCALGIFRDVVCGLPVDETLRHILAAQSGVPSHLISRRLTKRVTQCRLRTKDYKTVKSLLASRGDRSLAHASRFLELSPDLTLTQCLEAHKVLVTATNIIRRARKGYKQFSQIAYNTLDHRLCKSIFCAAEYRDGGYQDDCETQEVTREMAQRAADDAIALSQRVLASFTKKTLEHFKRWTCADIFEIVKTFSGLSDPALPYFNAAADGYKPVYLTENFLRVCSEQHLVGDLLALNAVGHERTEVLQNIAAEIDAFRLYRPRSVIKSPVRDTWPVLCDPKTYGGVTITCIDSTQGLKEEGRDMTHCVGGYTQNAWTGEPILSLSSSIARSTAQLRVQKEASLGINGKPVTHYELTCVQHRSLYNSQASASHRAALKKFMAERSADQNQLAALYKETAKKRKAIDAYNSDKNAQQHPEERGTALALHWPQFSFFMRKKRDCPYRVMSVDEFKVLYKERKRKRKAAQ